MFIGQWLRSAPKPLCISAQTLRARARAGRPPASADVRARTASTRRSPACPRPQVVVDQHRHPPAGLTARAGALELRLRPNAVEPDHDCLVLMPACVSNTPGRIDHDE